MGIQSIDYWPAIAYFWILIEVVLVRAPLLLAQTFALNLVVVLASWTPPPKGSSVHLSHHLQITTSQIRCKYWESWRTLAGTNWVTIPFPVVGTSAGCSEALTFTSLVAPKAIGVAIIAISCVLLKEEHQTSIIRRITFIHNDGEVVTSTGGFNCVVDGDLPT